MSEFQKENTGGVPTCVFVMILGLLLLMVFSEESMKKKLSLASFLLLPSSLLGPKGR
jgi:hypothetical protein